MFYFLCLSVCKHVFHISEVRMSLKINSAVMLNLNSKLSLCEDEDNGKFSHLLPLKSKEMEVDLFA